MWDQAYAMEKIIDEMADDIRAQEYWETERIRELYDHPADAAWDLIETFDDSEDIDADCVAWLEIWYRIEYRGYNVTEVDTVEEAVAVLGNALEGNSPIHLINQSINFLSKFFNFRR